MADKLERIDINNFNGRFVEHSRNFIEFTKKYNIKAPSLKTLKGQGIALLTCEENRNKYALREDLEAFFKKINMPTNDAIQSVNKCEQWGLKRGPTEQKNAKYYIPYPFEYIALHIEKNKNRKITGDRNEQINLIKRFVKTNYLDVPNDKWQVGHKDPNKTDNTNNLVYQPPIQGKYRDRFKFDDMGLIKIPTVTEISNNVDQYYSKNEQEELLVLLQKLLKKTNNEDDDNNNCTN